MIHRRGEALVFWLPRSVSQVPGAYAGKLRDSRDWTVSRETSFPSEGNRCTLVANVATRALGARADNLLAVWIRTIPRELRWYCLPLVAAGCRGCGPLSSSRLVPYPDQLFRSIKFRKGPFFELSGINGRLMQVGRLESNSCVRGERPF